jgi:hypothetical protein
LPGWTTSLIHWVIIIGLPKNWILKNHF